jgi:GNAT superfamily N-acetyltransferase
VKSIELQSRTLYTDREREVPIMQITAITDGNKDFFKGFFPEMEPPSQKNLLLLGSVDDGAACGALTLEIFPYHALLHSIAVSEPYRRKGFGSALLQTALSFIKKTNVTSVQTVVCGPVGGPAGIFFQKNGFAATESSRLFSAALSDIAKAEAFRAPAKPDPGILSFAEAPPVYIKQFNRFLTDPHQYIYDAADPGAICARCSMASVRHGKIDGCILFSPNRDGSVSLSWLYSETPERIMPLMKAALSALTEEYPSDTVLHIAAVNSSSLKITQKLIGDCAADSMESSVYTHAIPV